MSNKDLNYKEGEYSEQELEILFPGIKKKDNRGLKNRRDRFLIRRLRFSDSFSENRSENRLDFLQKNYGSIQITIIDDDRKIK